jgi:hypothetical protein
VKGVRQVRITPVDVSVKSLNEGDVFVLDTREVVCVWTGPRSNRAERNKVCDSKCESYTVVRIVGRTVCASIARRGTRWSVEVEVDR